MTALRKGTTARVDDGTWPVGPGLPPLTIAHRARRIIRRPGMGYPSEDSFAGIRWAKRRGDTSIDLDSRQCDETPGGSVPEDEGQVCHWDRVGIHDRAKSRRTGRRLRRARISRSTPDEVADLVLRGRFRVRTMIECLDYAHARGMRPMFELKDFRGLRGRRILEAVHQHALEHGIRYGVMALPENLHLTRLTPAYTMLLTRGTPTRDQLVLVDAIKGSTRVQDRCRRMNPHVHTFGPGSRLGRSA